MKNNYEIKLNKKNVEEIISGILKTEKYDFEIEEKIVGKLYEIYLKKKDVKHYIGVCMKKNEGLIDISYNCNNNKESNKEITKDLFQDSFYKKGLLEKGFEIEKCNISNYHKTEEGDIKYKVTATAKDDDNFFANKKISPIFTKEISVEFKNHEFCGLKSIKGKSVKNEVSMCLLQTLQESKMCSKKQKKDFISEEEIEKYTKFKINKDNKVISYEGENIEDLDIRCNLSDGIFYNNKNDEKISYKSIKQYIELKKISSKEDLKFLVSSFGLKNLEYFKVNDNNEIIFKKSFENSDNNNCDRILKKKLEELLGNDKLFEEMYWITNAIKFTNIKIKKNTEGKTHIKYKDCEIVYKTSNNEYSFTCNGKFKDGLLYDGFIVAKKNKGNKYSIQKCESGKMSDEINMYHADANKIVGYMAYDYQDNAAKIGKYNDKKELVEYCKVDNKELYLIFDVETNHTEYCKSILRTRENSWKMLVEIGESFKHDNNYYNRRIKLLYYKDELGYLVSIEYKNGISISGKFNASDVQKYTAYGNVKILPIFKGISISKNVTLDVKEHTINIPTRYIIDDKENTTIAWNEVNYNIKCKKQKDNDDFIKITSINGSDISHDNIKFNLKYGIITKNHKEIKEEEIDSFFSKYQSAQNSDKHNKDETKQENLNNFYSEEENQKITKEERARKQREKRQRKRKAKAEEKKRKNRKDNLDIKEQKPQVTENKKTCINNIIKNSVADKKKKNNNQDQIIDLTKNKKSKKKQKKQLRKEENIEKSKDIAKKTINQPKKRENKLENKTLFDKGTQTIAISTYIKKKRKTLRYKAENDFKPKYSLFTNNEITNLPEGFTSYEIKIIPRCIVRNGIFVAIKNKNEERNKSRY